MPLVTLTKPAITATKMEENSMLLWYEFLSAYFNNQTHELQAGTNSELFPIVQFGFQQTAMPEALEGAHIGIVLSDPGVMRQRQVGGVYQAFSQVLLEFTIRSQVKIAREDGQNSEGLCRRVAGLLFGLLCDRGAAIPLHQKGITKIRPSNPFAVKDASYQTRRIMVFSQYLFMTPASYGTTSRLGGD